MDTHPRIFVVGHNKTGTRSIHQFCSASGLRGVHWDDGRLAEAMETNRSLGRPLLTGYERYRVFSDMESVAHGRYRPRPGAVVPERGWMIHAYRWFPQLDRQYPGSLFIYNVRPLADWVESRLHHNEGAYAEACRAILARRSKDDRFSIDDLRAHWIDEFHEHARRVREHFSGSPALIEVDITAPDSGDRLASFLERHGFAVRSRVLRHLGAGAARAGRSESSSPVPAGP